MSPRLSVANVIYRRLGDAEADGHLFPRLFRCADFDNLLSLQLCATMRLTNWLGAMRGLVRFVLQMGRPTEIAEVGVSRIAVAMRNFMRWRWCGAVEGFTHQSMRKDTPTTTASLVLQFHHWIAVVRPSAEDAAGKNASSIVSASHYAIKRTHSTVGGDFVNPLPTNNRLPSLVSHSSDYTTREWSLVVKQLFGGLPQRFHHLSIFGL